MSPIKKRLVVIFAVVWNNTAGSGSPSVDQRFLYDDWNLLAIVDSGGAAT